EADLPVRDSDRELGAGFLGGMAVGDRVGVIAEVAHGRGGGALELLASFGGTNPRGRGETRQEEGYEIAGRVAPQGATPRSEAHIERNVVRIRQELEVLERVVESRDGGLDDRQRELDPESGREPFRIVIQLIPAPKEQIVPEAVLGAEIELLGIVRRVGELCDRKKP